MDEKRVGNREEEAGNLEDELRDKSRVWSWLLRTFKLHI